MRLLKLKNNNVDEVCNSINFRNQSGFIDIPHQIANIASSYEMINFEKVNNNLSSCVKVLKPNLYVNFRLDQVREHVMNSSQKYMSFIE